MNKPMRYLLLLIFFFLFHLPAYSKTGLGIIFGEPTGFSAKHKLSNRFALDGAFGYSFTRAIDIHSDFLLMFPGINKDPNLSLYFGGGLKLRFFQKDENKNNKNNGNEIFLMGPRLPVGINFFVPEHKLEFFFELAFVMGIIPEIKPGLDGGFGIRYYFR